MRCRRWLAVLLMGLGTAGCPDEGPKEASGEAAQVAALADQLTRQLTAGLNADSREALGRLLVVTSTTAGPPRALRRDELERLVYPAPPYQYVGAGRPGTMVVRDGARQHQVLQLIPAADGLRILATRQPLAHYLRGQGKAVPTGITGEVITFLTPQSSGD